MIFGKCLKWFLKCQQYLGSSGNWKAYSSTAEDMQIFSRKKLHIHMLQKIFQDEAQRKSENIKHSSSEITAAFKKYIRASYA